MSNYKLQEKQKDMKIKQNYTNLFGSFMNNNYLLLSNKVDIYQLMKNYDETILGRQLQGDILGGVYNRTKSFTT